MPTILGAVMLAYLATGLAVRRSSPVVSLGAFAWATLAGIGCLRTAGEPGGLLERGSLLVSVMFPALMLAATLSWGGRRVPSWLVPLAVAIGAIRFGAQAMGEEWTGRIVSLVVEPTLFGVAAVVAYRIVRDSDNVGLIQRFIAPGFVALAMMEAADPIFWLASGEQIGMAPWFVVATLVAAHHLVAAFDLTTHELARSLRTTEEMRRELEGSERRLRVIGESAYDLIAETDEAGMFRYVSPNYSRVLGYDTDELLGTDSMALVDPAEGRDVERIRRELSERGVADVPRGRIRHRDGSWRWFESVLRHYENADGEYRLLVMAHDITETQRAQEALRESEARFRGLSVSSSELISEIDSNGIVVYVSPNHERMTGYSPEELEGMHISKLVQKLASSLDVDGGELDVERVAGEAAQERLARVVDADGEERWFEVNSTAYRAFGGETRAMFVSRDVSERVRLELQLRDKHKLESLGRLAGGIAHDFNNLLGVVLGNAGLARDLCNLDPEARDALAEIEIAAERAGELTGQLLAFAGRGPLADELVDISQLVGEMANLLEAVISQDVRVEYDLADGLHAVRGGSGELRQVVMNLIVNASDSIVGAGTIALHTSSLEVDLAWLIRASLDQELSVGRYVLLRIEDTGKGMNEAEKARIFDPFFSTKGPSRGLGLAAVQGIVRRHRGAIRVESAIGTGTSIELLLPATDQRLSATSSMARDETLRGAGTVLVVDDDDSVRRIVKRALESHGFATLEVANGREAVAIFRDRPSEIDAVLLDLTMPLMGGEETLRLLQEIRPDIPVVLTSGYAEADALERLGNIGFRDFLKKPFRIHQLVSKIIAATR